MNDESLYGHIKESVGSASEAAKDRAAQFADEQKASVSETLQEFASAVEKAGEELTKRDQTLAAGLVRQAGDSLGSLSRSINSASVSDLVNSVRRFGRENPAAFIGGAVLAGLALGRFAQASARSSEAPSHQPPRMADAARSDFSGRSQSARSASPEVGRDSSTDLSGNAPSAPSAAGSISAGVMP